MNGQDQLKANGTRRGGQSSADVQVDVWLRQTLTKAYGDVLSEPLPEAWTRLIGNAGKSRTGR